MLALAAMLTGTTFACWVCFSGKCNRMCVISKPVFVFVCAARKAALEQRYQGSCQSSVTPTLTPTMLSSAAIYPVSAGATPH